MAGLRFLLYPRLGFFFHSLVTEVVSIRLQIKFVWLINGLTLCTLPGFDSLSLSGGEGSCCRAAADDTLCLAVRQTARWPSALRRQVQTGKGCPHTWFYPLCI